MRAAVLALDAQRGKRPLLAAYGMSPGMARLLLCSVRELNVKRKTHEILSTIPGYIEAGYDALSVGELRPLACWEPPNTLVALWPLPIDTRPGPFALDAGNLLRFASYPESDHEKGLALDLAGPDYMRVPADPEGRLEPEGIDYVNRWAVMIAPEPARIA